jgi:hypothetical protein
MASKIGASEVPNSHPVQATPVMRGLVPELQKFWFAGGHENMNAPAGFQEVENCGCHILSSYAVSNCLAVCG